MVRKEDEQHKTKDDGIRETARDTKINAALCMMIDDGLDVDRAMRFEKAAQCYSVVEDLILRYYRESRVKEQLIIIDGLNAIVSSIYANENKRGTKMNAGICRMLNDGVEINKALWWNIVGGRYESVRHLIEVYGQETYTEERMLLLDELQSLIQDIHVDV